VLQTIPHPLSVGQRPFQAPQHGQRAGAAWAEVQGRAVQLLPHESAGKPRHAVVQHAALALQVDARERAGRAVVQCRVQADLPVVDIGDADGYGFLVEPPPGSRRAPSTPRPSSVFLLGAPAPVQ
jgi:hypothetical protein